jgi:acyl carrier protein
VTTSHQSALTIVGKLVEEQLNFGSRVLDPDDDLWNLGMTSLTCLGLMLNLEDEFDVELPEGMLRHDTFRSVNSIVAAVEGAGGAEPADGE